MVKYCLISLMAVTLWACEDGSTTPPIEPKQTPVSIPSNPITITASTIDDHFLSEKKWVAPHDEHFVTVTAEYGFDAEGNKLTDGILRFHFWLCEKEDCSTGNLFFAVGSITGTGPQVCFSNITYWEPPPDNFFVKDNSDFCLSAKRPTNSDSQMLIFVDNQWLTFQGDKLDW